MANSSRSGKSSKRGKPHPDFPLFKHASGRWCKKVKGRFHYFGKVADDPDGKVALATWREQWTDILAGRKPRPNPGGLKLEDLCNEFLHHKQRLVDNGELTKTTWNRYKHNSEFVLKSGWLDWPRPKTAVPRRIPRWPETLEAVRDAVAQRPKRKDAADRKLLFIGRRGESYEGSRKGYRVTQESKDFCSQPNCLEETVAPTARMAVADADLGSLRRVSRDHERTTGSVWQWTVGSSRYDAVNRLIDYDRGDLAVRLQSVRRADDL